MGETHVTLSMGVGENHALHGAVADGAPDRTKSRSRIGCGPLLVAAIVVALTATATAPASATAADRSSAAPAPVLTFGSGYLDHTGSSAVLGLQRRLAQAGYAPGPLDGRFGPRTELAVRRFQAAEGLQVDGIAGPQTLAALTRPTLFPGSGVQAGGAALVRDLQQRLAAAGDTPGPFDGRFGPRTEGALRRFQATHDLPVDGIAGPQTAARLGEPSLQVAINRRPSPRARNSRSQHRGAPSRPGAIQGRPRPTPTRPTAVHPRATSSGSGWLVPAIVVAIMFGLLLLAAQVRRRRPRSSGALQPVEQAAVGNGAETAPEPLAGEPIREPASSAPSVAAPSEAEDPERVFPLGVEFEEQGDLASAQEAFTYADRRGHAAAASNLGVLLDRQGDLAGAQAAYARADQRGEPIGTFNLAALLEERGKIDHALDAYRRAAVRGVPAAAFRLGELLEDRGELAGAESAYRHADERGHGPAAARLGALLAHRSDFIGAEQAFRRADERGESAGTLQLGALLESRGDRAGAVAAYHRARQTDQGKVGKMAEVALLELGERDGGRR